MPEAGPTIRILHVEDDPRDADLVAVTLRDKGMRCEIVPADSRDAFVAALESGGFDVILADDRLPTFDGRGALRIAAERVNHVPFIFVSGTLGEEVAIERMKDGATDYVLKQRLSRLPAAIERALREARTRAERARAAEEVHWLNVELEARVADRTAALAHANTLLGAQEGELREAKGFLENLVAASPSMIFRIDPREFKFTYASPNVAWLLGYEPGEVVGVRNIWRRLLHPDDLERAAGHLRDALEACVVQIEEEYRLRAKDGRHRWFFSLMRIEYGEGKQPTTILWYCVDVSDRRAAEQALLESEDRTRAILRTANDAFVGIDSGGRIVHWNEQAERMFGWAREEAIGRIVADTIVPEPSREAYRRGLARSLESDAAQSFSRRLEMRALRRDGTEFPVELTLWASGGGGHRSFNAFVRDITERRRAEAAVRDAKEEAERANRAKSEFLSRMSHDLRTPLNAILGFAQLLVAERLTEGQLECVHQIFRGGQHLLDLINEVLDIARIEAGHLSLSPEPVGVGDIVRHVAELVRPLAAARDITLTIAESALADRAVVADRQRLSQILLNLLANAVKYNHAGGRVRLTLEARDGDRIRINVTDTGAGIPSDKLALLFRPFERLGAERSSTEGTGLGLTLSRRLAEAMHGSLGVASEVDRGSTFWLELGATDETAVPVMPADDVRPLPRAQSDEPATVLYIEDNVSNLRLMARLLAQRPALTLVHAPDGGGGLRLAREHRPDVIFLDLHLPDGSGEDVLRQLWSDPALRPIPVIVLSADATVGQVRRVLASGALAYLTKPLDLHKVLDVLDNAVRSVAERRRTTIP